MSSLLRIVVQTRLAGADVAQQLMPQTKDRSGSIRRIARLLESFANGARRADVEVCHTAVKATATLVLTGLPTANDTFVLCGTTFTAKAAGASGNEYNIGATAALTAAAIAAAVTASATTKVTGAVTASASDGTVTFTAKVPGAMGNGLVLTESMDNTTRVDFAGGSDGTRTSLAAGGYS